MKLATALAATVAAFTLAPVAAHAEDPTRVMLLGDSVTHGLEGEYTWRYFSWKGLEQTGAAVDFVGPHAGTWSEADEFGGQYADPNFDTDHAARYGLSMWEMLYWNNAETAPPVSDLMAYNPDVIVNTLGVNDLTGMNQTPEQAIDHSRKIVEQARAINPDVDFVLGALPQVWFERVPAYNSMLSDLAAELSTVASRVVVTPVADFTNRVDTYDDAHPTTLGQRKIAQAVSAGLAQLGIGESVLMPDPNEVQPVPQPEPTPAPAEATTPAAVAPAPVVAVAPVPSSVIPSPSGLRAVRKGDRVSVAWRTVSSADAYRVRCGTRSKVVEAQRVSLRTVAARCWVRSVGDSTVSPWASVHVKRQR